MTTWQDVSEHLRTFLQLLTKTHAKRTHAESPSVSVIQNSYLTSPISSTLLMRMWHVRMVASIKSKTKGARIQWLSVMFRFWEPEQEHCQKSSVFCVHWEGNTNQCSLCEQHLHKGWNANWLEVVWGTHRNSWHFPKICWDIETLPRGMITASSWILASIFLHEEASGSAAPPREREEECVFVCQVISSVILGGKNI